MSSRSRGIEAAPTAEAGFVGRTSRGPERGPRTLSSAPQWKYVQVRRFVDCLESSIERSTQRAVFEPNGEPLWAEPRQAISSFQLNQWRSGALQGAKQEQAFFVRLSSTTMTQPDLDQGQVRCAIGVALVRAAEFVILRLGWSSADAAR